MAISKIIYKENAEATPVVWMDTTDKTADSGNMLNGTTALKNDGTTATGNIASKTSSDLTASGATVTAPAGYYASSASKSVSSGSATTPATTITANPSISVSSSGLITASASATKSVTPTVSAGYVSSGTAGTITVSGSNTSQLTTQASATWYPSYGSTGSTKIIDSGTYCKGNQSIANVYTINLTPENIKDGVTVGIYAGSGTHLLASVTGTYAGSSTYSVDISLTNPDMSSAFYGFYIDEQYTDGWSQFPPTGEGSTIGSISSPTGSTSITLDTTSYGIVCYASGKGVGEAYIGTSGITCTGGVEYMGRFGGDMNNAVFRVTGDGTITLSGIIWDDD